MLIDDGGGVRRGYGSELAGGSCGGGEGGDKDEASPRPRVRVIRPVVGLAKMEGHHIDNKPTHA